MKKRKSRHSLIPKISLVLTATAILLFFSIGAGYRYLLKDNTRDEAFKKHLEKYLNYLAEDIGTPPDPDKIRDLEQQLGVSLMIRPKSGPIFGTQLPDPDLLQRSGFQRKQEDNNFYYYQKNLYLLLHKPDLVYVVKLQPSFNPGQIKWENLVYIFLGVTVILGIAFILLRRLMRPVAILREGSDILGSGDFDHRINVQTKDEFALLADSFNEMAEKLKKLISGKEQLLLDVSHELRSPIARMKLALELAPEFDTKNRLSDDVSELEQLTSTLLETYRQLHRAEKLALKNFSLNPVINEIVSNMAPQKFVNRIERDLIIKGNESAAKTVLRNILDNALKYSANSTQPIDLSCDVSGKDIVLFVRDYGIGVAPEELNKITEPFYRTDKSRQRKTGGFGLGLSLAARLMQNQDASLEFSIPEGPGLIAKLTFRRPTDPV